MRGLGRLISQTGRQQYLDAWLRQAGGLGQALSEADARVRVGLEGDAQELHVVLGEAGSLPATGAAMGAAGGRGPGVVWGGDREEGSGFNVGQDA